VKAILGDVLYMDKW